MVPPKTHLDFIVIGAQKAGTTSLFEYLRRHPQLFLPPGKEAPYFSHDSIVAQGWDSYMSKTFSSAQPGLRWGTVTPAYMVGGVYERTSVTENYDERTVPTRIRERAPDVRLIALLRDPVDRAHSHYRMTLMNGQEHRTFDEAIDELLHPDLIAASRRSPDEQTGYITWGEYGRILGGYLDIFPREQILIAFTDELDSTPETLLKRIHAFLGVSSEFVPDNLGTRYRTGGSTRRLPFLKISDARQRFADSRAARSLWRALPDSVRHPINLRVENAAYTVDLWNRRSSKAPDAPTTATQQRLREHFAQDARRLTNLLGVAPPWDTSSDD